MKVREYIEGILRPLGIGEAQLADVGISLASCSPGDVYCADNQKEVAVAMIGCVGSLLLAPRMESVNESGFSMTWNYADLSKWYLFMCRKWGVKPDESLEGLLGLSRIADKTSIW